MTDKSASDVRPAYWLYRFLPQKAAAYAQLARLDRPIGRQLLFWPCLWGLLLALYAQKLSLRQSAPLALSKADFLPFAAAHYHAFSPLGFLLFMALLFFIGAAAMRGAGCAYNDIVDYKIDARVARTAARPLPSGRVSRRQAWGFIGLQCFIGLLVLLQMNRFTIILAFCSLFIVALYPFMKRVTDWPQAVLGLAFNWGVLLGFSAVYNGLTWAALALYGGAALWTIGYDTIYAHQDRGYDALIGVRSTARLFGKRTRPALLALYALACALFFSAFWAVGGGFWPLFGVVLAAGCLGAQIIRFDADNAALCLRLFKSNAWLGRAVFACGCIGLL